MDEPVELHVVSDSTGETAARVVEAVEAQFPGQEFEVVRHPRITAPEDVHLAASRARGASGYFSRSAPQRSAASRMYSRSFRAASGRSGRPSRKLEAPRTTVI